MMMIMIIIKSTARVGDGALQSIFSRAHFQMRNVEKAAHCSPFIDRQYT
jgi:hypothetical protein